MLRERVNWDDYFMVEALWAKVRSPDVSTQHGCIAVNKNNRIIGQGYNGYAKGVDESKMPQSRPAKYPPILHADENTILNSNESLEGATMYITGPPCVHCWAQIIQKGFRRVVYGPITSKSIQSPHLKDSPDNQLIRDMLENHDIEVIRWIPQNYPLIQKELDIISQLIATIHIESLTESVT